MIFKFLLLFAMGFAQNALLTIHPQPNSILEPGDTLFYEFKNSTSGLQISFSPLKCGKEFGNEIRIDPQFFGICRIDFNIENNINSLEYIIQPHLKNLIEEQEFWTEGIRISLPSLAVKKEGLMEVTFPEIRVLKNAQYLQKAIQLSFANPLEKAPVLLFNHRGDTTARPYQYQDEYWIPLRREYFQISETEIEISVENLTNPIAIFTYKKKLEGVEAHISPNPFSPRIIPYSLGYDTPGTEITIDGPTYDKNCQTDIEIYHEHGWKINTLLKDQMIQNWPLKILWDGRDFKGRDLRNGKYRVLIYLRCPSGKSLLRKDVVLFQ